MRVVVVGSGFAGLTAARSLRLRDVDVEIIEGGSRAGGRARTVRSAFVDGQYVESGAEWVDTDHHRMRELLARHGLTLQGHGQEWTTIRRLLFRDGALLDPTQIRSSDPAVDRDLERYEAAFASIAEKIDDPARPDLHPDAATHDATSMRDIANGLDLGDLAALFARRNSQGEFAAEPDQVSSLFVAQQRAQMFAQGVGHVVRAHRIDGGLDGLVRAMVADLDVAIAFDEVLQRVSSSDDGVELVTSRRTMTADRLVLACSLVPLRHVQFDPPLPRALAAAIDQLGYGAITKTALQYPARSWPSGYANTSLDSQRVYEPTVDQPGIPGVLMAYVGGDGGRAQAQLTENERMRRAAVDIETMYQLTDAPLAGFSRAWSGEPRYGGSYAVYQPGQVTAHWQVLRQPCGPIWLAGEHNATWTGYLEGAVESGQRAADQITSPGTESAPGITSSLH
jgi:monoamine oxidase